MKAKDYLACAGSKQIGATMALNWNIEKCENYKELTEGDAWAITNALIWASMGIGLGEITAKNYQEFYQRISMQEKLFGTYTNKGGKPVYMTEQDIKRRIGLTTNVSTIPRSTFLKRVAKQQFKAA